MTLPGVGEGCSNRHHMGGGGLDKSSYNFFSDWKSLIQSSLALFTVKILYQNAEVATAKQSYHDL